MPLKTPKPIVLTPEAKAKFLSRVLVAEPNECWMWGGYVDHLGYGVFKTGKLRYSAHRVSYVIAFGPIPNGLPLDHLCCNRGCVNPRHLEAVTLGENTARGRGYKIGFCAKGHEVTAGNIRLSSGKHKCRICRNEYMRKYYAAHKLES